MSFRRKILNPEIYIRAGLGLTFLYSGYDIYKNPTEWIGYVNQLPQWMLDGITSYVTLDMFLLIQGVIEIFFGIVILFWMLPRTLQKIVAVAASIKFALILMLIGIDSATFRDIGLLGTAIALVAITTRRHY